MILGRTGIQAARLGFGGIPIQRVTEAQAVEVVRYALDKGMDFIDTSRVYTTSETRIGKALKESSQKAAVATKSFSRSADGIRKDVETSLRELQMECIDIYQCHGVSNEEEYRAVTSPGGALAGLQRAREEGLIRHIGITSHSLDLLDRVLDDGLFETIMVCFSFLEPAAKDRIIPKAVHKGVGVIAMKPLSGGVIEAPEAALKWVLSFPDILVIAGVEEKRFIDQNWKVFQGDYAMTEEEKRTMGEICREYDRKFCRRCDYCLPCPVGIPIQFALGVRSMVRRMGLPILQTPVMRDMREKAVQCTECMDCVARCPYGLPIPEMIRTNIDWLNANYQGAQDEK
jgi:predicted aldo/keto reductase-like oxidoreductase